MTGHARAVTHFLHPIALLGRSVEAVPLPTRVQFDKPFPTPNSDDIKFYEMWKDGPADLDVDAIVKRWRSQER